MSRTRTLVLVTALLCAAGLGRAADARAAELVLRRRRRQPPRHLQRPDPGVDQADGVHRLAGADEQIVGLDVRPANKQVVAVGSTSRLYRIDGATGAATAIGSAAFVPGARRLELRLRLQPDGRPDPRHLGRTSEPEAAPRHRCHGGSRRPARLRSGRRRRGLDATRSSRRPTRTASPEPRRRSSSTWTRRATRSCSRTRRTTARSSRSARLGIDIGDSAGFDISGVDGVAYVAAQVGPERLVAALHGQPRDRRDDTGRPDRRCAPARARRGRHRCRGHGRAGRHAREGSASTKVGALLRTGVRLRATCSEGCTLSAQILSGSRVVGSGKPVATDLAGSAPLRLVFRTAAKKEFASRRTAAFTLVVTARDAAGNTTTARQTLRASR